MKVVAVLGSPRKHGNSAGLAAIVTETLAKYGGEVVRHHLNGMSFRGCQACGACKTTREDCVLDDDLTRVLEDVRHADVVILASPVYWGEVTSQMKGFIDRTYSYLTPDFMTAEVKHRLPAGKKLVFIQTQGAADEKMFADIFPRYNSFFEQLHYFDETFFLRGCGLNERDGFNARLDLRDQAHQAAMAIAAK